MVERLPESLGRSIEKWDVKSGEIGECRKENPEPSPESNRGKGVETILLWSRIKY